MPGSVCEGYRRPMEKNVLSPEQLAVCSWSLRPKGLDDLVSMVREIELPRVQLALNAHRVSAGGERVGEALEAAGVTIVSGMFGTAAEDYSTLESIRRTGGMVPDETWEENLALACDIAAAARALGLKLVTFHAGFLPEDRDDPDYEKLLDRLQIVAGIFAGAGVELAFETGQETAPLLSQFLDDLAAPNVGVNFDPANMLLYDKGDPVEAVRTLMPYVKHVHIKDANVTKEPGTWGEEVAVGTGQVDWPAFLGALRDAGYTGNMVIEREAGETRRADIIAAKRHIEHLMGVLS